MMKVLLKFFLKLNSHHPCRFTSKVEFTSPLLVHINLATGTAAELLLTLTLSIQMAFKTIIA